MQAEEDGKFVGARLDAGLSFARFASSPSVEEFAAELAPKNVPAEKVGLDVAVEAMMSNAGHVFYGDLKGHEKVSVPFSTFIHSCKSYLGHLNSSSDSFQRAGNSQGANLFRGNVLEQLKEI